MSKITKSAKGQECQIRIPGTCSMNNETVVACHLNGYGYGAKHPDLFVAYGCSACHDAVDGRTPCEEWTYTEKQTMFYQGVLRTQKILLDMGLIKI